MGKRPKARKALNDEQKALVENNWKLALRFSKDHLAPFGMDEDDWQSECIHALCEAALTFDRSVSRFSTWAYLLMRQRRNHIWNFSTYWKRDCRKTVFIGDHGEKVVDFRGVNSVLDKDDARYCLSLMDKREVEIVTRKLDGERFREIGRTLGISKQRTQQIYSRALEQVRAQLKVG